MKVRHFLPVLLVTLAVPAPAAESGFAAKASDVLERPVPGSRVIGRIGKKQGIEILARSGGWAKIAAGGASGWVAAGDLRLAPRRTATSAPPARATGGRDTGIRGFSEEELMVGAPNRIEAGKLKAYAASAKDAANFARIANLRQRQQDYLDMQDYMPDGKLPEGFFDE